MEVKRVGHDYVTNTFTFPGSQEMVKAPLKQLCVCVCVCVCANPHSPENVHLDLVSWGFSTSLLPHSILKRIYIKFTIIYNNVNYLTWFHEVWDQKSRHPQRYVC